jgi:membrane associated rhomboid family serine protease
VTQDHTTAAPTCYRHPDRSTLLSCSRCGRPICSACSIDAAVGQRCPECVRDEGVQRIIPSTPTQRRTASDAPATRAFLAIAIGLFVITGIGGRTGIVAALAQDNALVAAGEWWRIFTVVLLHGSVTHIIFNMWALWVLGPQIERSAGSWPFAGLYLASAGFGGVAAFYWGGESFLGVGASGAIFGLFGVWLNWALHRRNTMWGRALLGNLGFLLLINAAIPFLIPGIAWQAHVGGLVAGFAIGEIWSRVRGDNVTQLRTAVAFVMAALAAVTVLI